MSLEKQLNTLLKTGYAPEDQNFNTALPPPPPPPSTSPPRTPKVTPEGTKQKHGQRLTEEERQIMKELRNQLSGHRKLLQQQLGSISKLRTEKERAYLQQTREIDNSRESELKNASTLGKILKREGDYHSVSPLKTNAFPQTVDTQMVERKSSPNQSCRAEAKPYQQRQTSREMHRTDETRVSPDRRTMDPLARSHWVLHQANKEVEQRKQTELVSKQMTEELERNMKRRKEIIASKRDELNVLHDRILQLSESLNEANERVTERDLQLLDTREKLAKLVKATKDLISLSKEYENAGGNVKFSSGHALRELTEVLNAVVDQGISESAYKSSFAKQSYQYDERSNGQSQYQHLSGHTHEDFGNAQQVAYAELSSRNSDEQGSSKSRWVVTSPQLPKQQGYFSHPTSRKEHVSFASNSPGISRPNFSTTRQSTTLNNASNEGNTLSNQIQNDAYHYNGYHGTNGRNNEHTPLGSQRSQWLVQTSEELLNEARKFSPPSS